MSYSDLGRYLFVSKDNNDRVGSIYYERGRIRLVHKDGPTVDTLKSNEYVAYFVLPHNFDYNKIKIKYQNLNLLTVYEKIYNVGGRVLSCTNFEIKEYLKYVDPYHIGFIGLGACDMHYYYLYEVYLEVKNNLFICIDDHVSRGFPYGCNIADINSYCYKDIYKYASTKNNHSTTHNNIVIYGCFYGWYTSTRPFEIHSPYEYDIYVPLSK